MELLQVILLYFTKLVGVLIDGVTNLENFIAGFLGNLQTFLGTCGKFILNLTRFLTSRSGSALQLINKNSPVIVDIDFSGGKRKHNMNMRVQLRIFK